MSERMRRWLGNRLIETRRWWQRQRDDLAWLTAQTVISAVVSYLMTLV
ncbi:hypothetical protein [Actinomadura hibisca]|nr:hypothetical protein [Actinomadura hibisca]